MGELMKDTIYTVTFAEYPTTGRLKYRTLPKPGKLVMEWGGSTAKEKAVKKRTLESQLSGVRN